MDTVYLPIVSRYKMYNPLKRIECSLGLSTLGCYTNQTDINKVHHFIIGYND